MWWTHIKSSEDQKKKMCQIIANTHLDDSVGSVRVDESEQKEHIDMVKVAKMNEKSLKSYTCGRETVSSNVTEVIDKIVKATSTKGKIVIKIEIEIHNK